MREAYRLEAATIALQWVLSGCPSSHLFVHALETLQRLLLPAVWLEAHALPASFERHASGFTGIRANIACAQINIV